MTDDAKNNEVSESDDRAVDSGSLPAAPDNPTHKEPSLGPACLVVAILSMALFCSICGFGSWYVFSDQYPLAIKGIQQQLIPWVETSQLGPEDKTIIVAELRELIPKLEDETIDKRQLTRLHNCLQDNPVLLWGGIESIIAQGPAAGLNETEQETLQRLCERLLRAAVERKVGRNDVEFTIQNCAKVRKDGQSIEVTSPLTAAQIREFMKRAEQLVNQNGVPNEPFDKTAGEAFAILIESALDVE